MSITDTQVIDSVILSNEAEDAVLLITDHLDWFNPEEHLVTLQQKMNTYIEFVESKQIYTEFPKAEGKNISITVACKFEPVETALQFYQRASEFLLEKVNIEFSYSFES